MTVAINKTDYICNVEGLLNDTDTYLPISYNPVKNLETSFNALLKRWQQNKYISTDSFRKLRSSDGLLPRAYGLPKIYKKGCPYRIIVSYVGSPLHNFSLFFTPNDLQ